jgi:hypothetical protein
MLSDSCFSIRNDQMGFHNSEIEEAIPFGFDCEGVVVVRGAGIGFYGT